mgnify:CR=1 FL=1
MQTYTITRLFRDSPRRTVVKKGLSLEQAQAHCSDPETSSSTCEGERAKKYTKRHGDWFDAYEEE